MKNLFLLILFTSLLQSCKPTVCDCINDTVDQALEVRKHALVFFDLGSTELCDEVMNGLTEEEQLELTKKSLDCPNYYKLDSIQEQIRIDGLKGFNLNTESPLNIKKPEITIQRIFETYNQYNESTDSQSNLDSLKQSLALLENSDVNNETLDLVINVWMYYTVSDYSAQEYTESVLFAHKKKCISALKNRINNKLEWETEDGAPFSELPMLLEKLKVTK